MKKALFSALAILMAFILCVSFSVFAYAENDKQEERVSNIHDEPIGEFDYSVLQNLSGYEYDKFDKYWSYQDAYDEAYSDADIIIGIALFGENGGNNLEEAKLYTKVIDKKGEKLMTVKSMDFLIDDVLYSYHDMPTEDGTMAGSVVLYDTGYELVKAFAEAKEVSVKLSFYGDKSISFDMDQTQFSQTLQEVCKNIIKYNIWDYYISNWLIGSLESTWDLTITK